MKASRTVFNLIMKRTYRTNGWRKKHPNPGIQSRLGILENEVENIENIDLENVESDFMQAHQSYDSYKKELAKNKELLKLRIVTRKYFKNPEPNLLTLIEKEQIRFLHNNDPVEYSPEKLSESFPALPKTIRKILRANWKPKSADRVLKHDQLVIENWEKYKLGRLPLEPDLEKHLEKFKGRKVSLPNMELIETKLIPPPKILPKPKSELYSGIIRSYLDRKSNVGDDNKATSDAGSELTVNGQHFDGNDLTHRQNRADEDDLQSDPRHANEVGMLSKSTHKLKISGGTKKREDQFTLNEFFENSIKNITGTPSMEDKVLMDTYKRTIGFDLADKKKIVEAHRLEVEKLNLESKKSDPMPFLTQKDVQSSINENKQQGSIEAFDSTRSTELATYVKARVQKAVEEEDKFPQFINIPKKKYDKSKVYQIKDRYYDHDGEFLYRVPGLRD